VDKIISKHACTSFAVVLLLFGLTPQNNVMSIPRPFPIILAVLVSAVAGATAVMAETSPEPAKVSPAAASVMTTEIDFYLARGEADACGRGCNEWIAAEGKIDAGAASRLRRLMAKLGRRRPAIYLHSPGGSIAGALELGRLIHDQKLTVSVAHTVPRGCERDKTFEKSCEALKRSGQALESEFDQTVALCNSSCVYVLSGGVVRVVPPWVKLGIHDVGLDPDKKPPPAALAEQVKKVAHAHIQDYLRDMGFDKGLFTAASAIPYTSHRFLERDEVVRFGIDRRDFGESVWRFVDKPKLEMDKRFFLRIDGDQVRYVDGLASLVCGAGTAVGVALTRLHVASGPSGSGLRPVGINVNGQRIDLPNQIPSRDFDTRWASVPASTFDTIGDATIGVSGFGLDGSVGSLALNTDGFSAAYAKLRKSCDESARGAVALAPLTAPSTQLFTTPWTKPIVSPFALGDKSAWEQNPPAAQGPAAPQNAPAAATPPQAKTVQSAPTADLPPQAEPIQRGCTTKIADAPLHVTGRVTSFIPDEQALERTSAVEAQLGAEISPAYVSLRRVVVERYPQSDDWSTMAAVPENLNVKIGDVVELNSRYRDPGLPCHFIPWTIDHLVDHAE
jgi:hypothetical protein